MLSCFKVTTIVLSRSTRVSQRVIGEGGESLDVYQMIYLIINKRHSHQQVLVVVLVLASFSDYMQVLPIAI